MTRGGSGSRVGKEIVANGINYTSRFIAILTEVRPIQGVHVPVRLVNTAKEHIGWLLVLPYSEWPELIVSTARVFKASGTDDEGYRVYTEVIIHHDVFGIYKGDSEPVIHARAGEIESSAVRMRSRRL